MISFLIASKKIMSQHLALTGMVLLCEAPRTIDQVPNLFGYGFTLFLELNCYL